jgi:hypothetical protein
MREAMKQHYYHLSVFSGCLHWPQDRHFFPRYNDLAQAAAIANFFFCEVT